ncbi:hypothetical protein [Olleya sp. HaHaR_3_96]|uniref:hypothetical protein n=1 Tax=Olleya sp. HaHaR_3_96 TaxID=2745560 RepID=UPI001C4EEE3C|nr:hypothetical protein [Olleya sp. HaHaR_3_96]QXP59627.1 hypothetical protein H0I26_17180 [Olleya sp. HaHaR_3_96]
MRQKKDIKEDLVFDQFKVQIENKGMTIESIDTAELILIKKGDLTLEVSLDNVRKNYARDKDKTHISDLVGILADYSIEIPEDWNLAKNDIYISLHPNDFDCKEFINFKITNEIDKVYIHTGNDKFSLISKNDLSKWNITELDLENQAKKNADKLLSESVIEFDILENRKLGMLESKYPNLKSALLLAPSMAEKVKTDFSFPFFAVIPVRDFCYIFSENDFQFFASKIGKVVVDEYKKSGYQVTTEILKFTEKGIEAVGKYPVE